MCKTNPVGDTGVARKGPSAPLARTPRQPQAPQSDSEVEEVAREVTLTEEDSLGTHLQQWASKADQFQPQVSSLRVVTISLVPRCGCVAS